MTTFAPHRRLMTDDGPMVDDEMPDDGGSVTITLVGVMVAMLCLVSALALYAKAVTCAEKARATADQAALAGASAVLDPLTPGDPCHLARQVAHRNEARLVSCRVMSTSVQVEVSIDTVLGQSANGRARAGAPEGDAPQSDARAEAQG